MSEIYTGLMLVWAIFSMIFIARAFNKEWKSLLNKKEIKQFLIFFAYIIILWWVIGFFTQLSAHWYWGFVFKNFVGLIVMIFCIASILYPIILIYKDNNNINKIINFSKELLVSVIILSLYFFVVKTTYIKGLYVIIKIFIDLIILKPFILLVFFPVYYHIIMLIIMFFKDRPAFKSALILHLYSFYIIVFFLLWISGIKNVNSAYLALVNWMILYQLYLYILLIVSVFPFPHKNEKKKAFFIRIKKMESAITQAVEKKSFSNKISILIGIWIILFLWLDYYVFHINNMMFLSIIFTYIILLKEIKKFFI